ncbi:DNA-directed RNA polymerase I subunit RPA34.5-domain-containing protein [Tuber brumale]|nr:DNA-directed RNA polymerase I subunit RPA34.5-domain-containing protein [Tuber brumale]
MSSSANTAKKRLTKPAPAPAKQKQKQGKAKPRSTQKVTTSDAEDDSASAGYSESASASGSASDSAPGSEEEEEGKEEEEEGKEEEEEEEEEDTSAPSESDDEYHPPVDFVRLPPPVPSSRNPFSSKNLAGKELWLISAPVSAPLSKLGSVNAADVLDNAQVLGTSSGRMFSVRETDEGAGVQVLVPNGRGGYLLGGKKITKSVQFFETLPDRGPEKRSEEVIAKSVRAQPNGLKMRFKPMGYVGNQDEDGMPDAVEPEALEPVRKKRRESGEEGGFIRVKGEHGERKHKSKKNRKETLP